MKIVKRDGAVEDFDANKIYGALIKAAQSVFVVSDDLRQNLARIAQSVANQLEETHSENITISMIQALVEEKLLSAGYLHIAEHYISYRLQRDIDRTDYKDNVVVHLHLERIR
jgi:anaerobic ribonucleoside-triphosphate reductase